MLKRLKQYGRAPLILAAVALMLCGCGDDGETTTASPGTETAVTTEKTSQENPTTSDTTAANGLKGEYQLDQMTYRMEDVWGGDGAEYGGTVRFDLKESMLLMNVMEDKGDVTDPELQAGYRDGTASNYEAEMTLLDVTTLGDRPAFGVTGDVLLSGIKYRLFAYVIRSNNQWYVIQFFQKEGEDHQAELETLLGSLSFSAETQATLVYYSVGDLEYAVPSDWRGDGSVNANGAAYFYPDHGMLMVEVASLSGDLSSPEVQEQVLSVFNSGMDQGEIRLTNTFYIGENFAFTAAGECEAGGRKSQITTLYVQVGDTLYDFTVGAFEGHYNDYVVETQSLFSSVKVKGNGQVNTESNSGETTGQPADGIRPEFKATMDEYEAFFTEYCGFLKSMQESDNPTASAEYVEFVENSTEILKKLQSIDVSELSPEESAYYTEVMTRINDMLSSISDTP